MQRTRIGTVAVIAAVAAVAALAAAHAGVAAQCSTEATVSDPGDDGGKHQLRASLDEVCSGGTVKVIPGRIVLRSGELSITRSVTIRGLGPSANPTVLDAGGNGRVLSIADADVTLEKLTITGGDVTTGDGFDGEGGGILAIRSSLVLVDAVVTSNRAQNGGGIGSDGGTLVLRDSTVAGNTGTSTFGGTGGIVNGTFNGPAILRLEGASAVAGNVSDGSTAAPEGVDSVCGAGIASFVIFPGDQATVTLADNSRVSGNRSVGAGGGICSSAFFGGEATVVVQDRARIEGNTAGTAGGGIFNWTFLDGTSAVHLGGESRITGNTAPVGGGVLNCSFGSGMATVTGSDHVTGNSVGDVVAGC